MTNLQKIANMSIDELAEWLDENGQYDNSPWNLWWDENYCSKCESIECTYAKAEEKLDSTPYYRHTIKCAYCELENKCKFFPELEDVPDSVNVIKMWLEVEAE